MRLWDNLAADLHLYLDAMATLDGPSDPNPAPYPYGPFGSAQRDRMANGPEALGELVQTYANASQDPQERTSYGQRPRRQATGLGPFHGHAAKETRRWSTPGWVTLG